MAAAKSTAKPKSPAKPRTTRARTAAKAPTAKAPAKAATTKSPTKAPAKPRAPAAPKVAAPVAAPQSTASRALGIASIGALAVAVGAALFETVRRLTRTGNAEHKAPDLALDQPRPGAEDRAPVDFRPDPTAAVPASEREGLRPATGPAPSMVNSNARDFALTD